VNQHPARFFIKYLLVTQERIGLSNINSTLRLYGLCATTGELLQEVRDEVDAVPDDFRPWSRAHLSSTRWLKKQRIFELIHPDDSVKGMKTKILEDPMLRGDVDTLLLGNVSCREAAYRLQKLRHRVDETEVAAYKHYFWNTDVMGLSDWTVYFDADTKTLTGSGRTTADPRMWAALQAGPEVALHKVGVRKEIDTKIILDTLQRELYHSFLEVSALPISSKKVELMLGLTTGLLKVEERLQAGDAALHEVLKRFEKFRVLTDQSAVPSLVDLAPTGTVSDRDRADILAMKEAPR